MYNFFFQLAVFKEEFTVNFSIAFALLNYVIVYVDDTKIFKMWITYYADILSKTFPVASKQERLEERKLSVASEG